MSADAMLRSLSDDSWRWIEQGRIEGAERDRISGLRNAERMGERNGRREQALSSARNMLAMNLGTYEQIAKATELPLEEVEKLANQM